MIIPVLFNSLNMTKPIDIKIYGSGTSSQMYLGHLIDSAFNSCGINHVIQHINDVNKFIEKNFNAIPAIEVEDQVVFELKGTENFHSSIRKFIQALLKKNNYGNMKNILVPTDFSACSNNAFAYAVQIANYLDAYIKVVHAYYPSYTEVEGIPYINETEVSKRKEILDKFVENNNKDFIGEVLSSPMIEGEMLTGFPAEAIQSYSKDSDLIVMGTHGQREVEKKIFGSVSISVALHAAANVIIVPENCQFKPIKKIAIPLNFERLSESCIEKLTAFANHFGADVDIIHFLEKPDAIREDLNFDNLSKSIKGSTTIKFLYGEDFGETINEYAINNHFDMICIARKHKSFLQNLFSKSHTKDLIIKGEVPILVVHEQ